MTTSEDVEYDILTEVDNKGKDLVDEKKETRKQQTKLSTDKQKYDVPVTAEVEYMEDKTPNSEYEEVVEYVDDDTTNAPSQQ
uniref:Ty3-gypsy retrotransposon protein n=1 Tax=Heterorhabditis bacteriophora TaxID=37862 RepID=A0A1I7XLV2_HETBA